jgi:HPt (histidine-containing phosphotransfer) domain-containing protein
VELLNEDRLDVLRGLGPADGRGLLPRLVESFVADAPAALAVLRTAGGEGAAALSEEAHRLKGAAANLGANRLAAVCAELEAAGRGDGTAEIGDLLDRLEIELTATCGALQETVAAAGEVGP